MYVMDRVKVTARRIKMTKQILTWEAYALIQLAQAHGWALSHLHCSGESDELMGLSVVAQSHSMQIMYAAKMPLAEAYRAVDASTLPYVKVLEEQVGDSRGNIRPADFDITDVAAPRERGIIVCPFPSHGDLFLPAQVWNYIIRLLRSYGLPVYFMGDRDTRMDSGIFTEGEVLSNLPVEQKLAILKDAALVVGTPNAWTHIALGFNTNLIVTYHVAIPDERWFPAVPKEQHTYGRILYSPYSLDIAGFIATMRLVIKEMK